MLGVPILVMGVLCIALPARRKVWMHIAVLFGLVACLGGLDFFAVSFPAAMLLLIRRPEPLN